MSWRASSPTAWAACSTRRSSSKTSSGAGGTIGGRARRRGHARRLHAAGRQHGFAVSAPVLTPSIRYDSIKDFEPIGLTANAPVAVVARKDFPAKDLKEFIAYVKANGDSVKQAHGGVGSSSHMACLLFTTELGLKPRLIPYRGTGPALGDLIGDHVDFFCDQVVSVAPAVKGKSIMAYVVSGDTVAGLTGRAFGQGSRYPRISTQHLERDVCAERDAERDPRPSSLARSTRRSTTRRSPSGLSISVAPFRARRSAARHILRRCSKPTSPAGIRC